MTTWVAELQDALGGDAVLTDPDVTAAYARDQAVMAPAGVPAAVVFPRSTEQLSAVLRVASRHGVPVVPRGAGSGLAGGSNAVDGGITLVMTRMDAVLEISPADRLLVARSDSGGPAAAQEIAMLTALCEEAGAQFVHSTDDQSEGDLLLAARRMALPALERVGGATLVDDVAVPRSRIAGFLDGCDAIAAERDLVIGVVGHAGDGNMHPTVCFDPADAAQTGRAHQAFDDTLALGLSLGGTITGEHGLGTIKLDWLEHEIGPVPLDVRRSTKAALDPAGLPNPGTVFRPAGPTANLVP